MSVLTGNHRFAMKRSKTQPVVKVPKNVKHTLQIKKAYENGIFQIEPQRMALYDRCYLFEDINYINKNVSEQKSFLTGLMFWLNSMEVEFKITLANTYQDMEQFLQAIRLEKNEEQYPELAKGIRQWQDDRIGETNPHVTTLRYLTITAKADSETNARIYLNAVENTIYQAFAGWGSRIVCLNGQERFLALHKLIRPNEADQLEYILSPKEAEQKKRDWKVDLLPSSIKQYKNFMIFGKTYVTVLFGHRYGKAVDSDSFIRSLTNVSYPSFLTLDYAPVDAETVNDKLINVQMNTERAIAGEIDEQRKIRGYASGASYYKEKRKDEIEDYIDRLDQNDEKGYFVNLLLVITADSEEELAKRMKEMQAVGKKEKVVLETCDYTQLKAWNTALPIGGRQVDYMRFFLTSSLVAFQPYFAQDIIEPGGQMLGLNNTTKHFIVGDRKKLPNPHGIIIGTTGMGKSMYIKLTEVSQTLLATDDDIIIIDPQNEFQDSIKQLGGSYFDLTPNSGDHMNGFEVSAEVFASKPMIRRRFVAAQTEYAKTLCAAAMKNINVTQEHDSVISRCTEKMYEEVFAQKKLKKQPTLLWLRQEIKKALEQSDNEHDRKLIREIYNCLEEYTEGSCNMLARPSNMSLNRRLVGFGMTNVPENNWEAVMVTILHYLSVRMEYNKRYQRATHLVVDETQVVSKKPGSALQLNNAVITFRKFGGIVTMAMQNVTAALSNQTLTELFQNCSYKVFLDQGGVDAQALAAIQELSAKEYRALSSGKIGEGVMVWNKKVVLFDARISKENVLYQNYSTNFHEMAENVPKFGTQEMKERVRNAIEAGVPKFRTSETEESIEADVPKFGTSETEESIEADVPKSGTSGLRTTLTEEKEALLLRVAGFLEIDAADASEFLKESAEACQDYLTILEQHGKLLHLENGKYRKV